MSLSQTLIGIINQQQRLEYLFPYLWFIDILTPGFYLVSKHILCIILSKILFKLLFFIEISLY